MRCLRQLLLVWFSSRAHSLVLPFRPSSSRRTQIYHQSQITEGRSKSIIWRKNERLGLLIQSASQSETVNDEPSSSSTSKQQQQQQPRRLNPTHRSAAVFALMEGGKRQSMFAVRRLENNPDYLVLEQRDRSFSRLLVTTAERRMGQIDHVLKHFMSKSNRFRKSRPQDMLCQACLRVGAAQLLFLDIPSYAVLKETVDVLRMHPNIKVSKPIISFVNAILRSVDREGREILETKTSIYDNIAPWLVKEWKSSYGHDKAQLIAEASMMEPLIFLTVNHDLETTTDKQRLEKVQWIQNEFSRNGQEEEVELLPQHSIRVPSGYFGSVTRWPLYEEGHWWVQDVSATLPALALYKGLLSCGADSNKPSKTVPNMRVVDLCSSPGGKTAQLCSLGFRHVTAVEVSKRRTTPLKENLARLSMTDRVDVIVADGTKWVPSDNHDESDSRSTGIDGVLVDAPCSATGVGSRRPDVLRKSPEMDELLETQRQLAAHTADRLLTPGGIMVYATCSLLQQESEEQMKWLLRRNKVEGGDDADISTMETVPFEPGEIPGFDDAIDENGWLRVLPGVLPGTLSRCDGFFVARLRKVR